MNLTTAEYNELKSIREKMEAGKSSSKDMQKALGLIVKSSNGNKQRVEEYARTLGFSGLDDFKEKLKAKNQSEVLTNGLLIIGGAVLVAWLLSNGKNNKN